MPSDQPLGPLGIFGPRLFATLFATLFVRLISVVSLVWPREMGQTSLPANVRNTLETGSNEEIH